MTKDSIVNTTSFPPAFENFVAPARNKPQIWRILLGMIIIIAGLALTTFLYVITYEALTDAGFGDEQAVFGKDALDLALTLLSLTGLTLGVWLAVRLLHGRGLMSVIGPLRPALRNFAIAAAVLFGIQLIGLSIWAIFYDAIPYQPLSAVLTLLPLAIILVFLQTSAEEIAFRGYLMQQLAARFQSRWIWFVVPQIIFALIHFDPEIGQPLIWLVLIIILVTAFAWADLTHTTGNLGAACGWHFANNLFLMTIIGNKDQLNGFVYQTTPYLARDFPLPFIGMDIAISVITWAILRRVLRG